MRFNLLRSTTAWVCLLGLTLFAHATLADSSFSSGNAVGARMVRKPSSIGDGTLTVYKTSSVDDGTVLNVGRLDHGKKPTESVDDGTLLTKRSNNAHENNEISALLDTGVDVLAAKRVIDTKTRALGQVSEAPGTGLEPAKRGKYWCMLCQCC